MVPGYRRDLTRHAFGHSLFRLSSAVAVAAGLGACLPADQRPDLGVAVTRSFGAGERRAAPPVSPDWPRLFRSPELNRLVERTVGENFDIAIAMTRIRQADAQSRISSAALYPTLSWESSRIERLCFAVISTDPTLAPSTEQSDLDLFSTYANNAPYAYAGEKRTLVYGLTLSPSEEYYKLGSYYQISDIQRKLLKAFDALTD